jgi:hypothetical protein
LFNYRLIGLGKRLAKKVFQNFKYLNIVIAGEIVIPGEAKRLVFSNT